MSQRNNQHNPFTSGAKLVGNVLRELLVARKERQMVEKEAEAKKEVIDLKQSGQNAASPVSKSTSTTDENVDSLTRATEVVQEYDTLLAQAEQQETCDFCRALISAVRNRPIDEQRVLLPELQTFLDEAKGDSTREELIQMVRQNDRLSDLVEDVLGVPPSSDDDGASESQARNPLRGGSDGDTNSDGYDTNQSRLV